VISRFKTLTLNGRAITNHGYKMVEMSNLQERLEAAFEYSMDHPEALMLICGTLFGIISVIPNFDSSTLTFLRLMAIGLVACGILFYALRLGLRIIIRVFHKILKM
jgi:hypothetical protein